MDEFEIIVEGGRLWGTVAGQGVPVLLLHGGPGLPWTYLEPLIDELSSGYRVAVYQQRGLPPSAAGAPYDVRAQSADVAAVLDGLGWERALLAGHSWGGHLLLHVLADFPERIAAALVIDTLGGVGDGGEGAFGAELQRRTAPEDVERAERLDQQAMEGQGTEADLAESLRLRPAYSPSPPRRRRSRRWHSRWRPTRRRSRRCATSCRAWPDGWPVRVPTLFVHGGASPMPVTASTASAEAIGPSATVEVLAGAGHFPWIERPGALRSSLDRLSAATAA